MISSSPQQSHLITSTFLSADCQALAHEPCIRHPELGPHHMFCLSLCWKHCIFLLLWLSLSLLHRQQHGSPACCVLESHSLSEPSLETCPLHGAAQAEAVTSHHSNQTWRLLLWHPTKGSHFYFFQDPPSRLFSSRATSHWEMLHFQRGQGRCTRLSLAS